MDKKFEVWWEETFGYGDYGMPPDEAIKAWHAGRAAMESEHDALAAANIDLTERVLYAERERDEERELRSRWEQTACKHATSAEVAQSEVKSLTAELARKDAALEDAEKWASLCIALDEGDISVILEGATKSIDGGEIVTAMDDVLDHIEARRSTR